MAVEKSRVLFLCAHNAARSQIAEALLRHHAGDRFEARSAGLDPTAVHPLVREVLAERAIDTRGLRAKSVREFLGGPSVRYAIVLCQERSASCPRIYPFATRTLYWPVADPVEGADEQGAVRERFRRVRDAIEARLRAWLAENDAPMAMVGS
jgi:arsenate reductase